MLLCKPPLPHLCCSSRRKFSAFTRAFVIRLSPLSSQDGLQAVKPIPLMTVAKPLCHVLYRVHRLGGCGHLWGGHCSGDCGLECNPRQHLFIAGQTFIDHLLCAEFILALMPCTAWAARGDGGPFGGGQSRTKLSWHLWAAGRGSHGGEDQAARARRNCATFWTYCADPGTFPGPPPLPVPSATSA